MPKMRITVSDDGGPVRGRLGVLASPGPHKGERFVHVAIGALDLSVDGGDEIAAARCQAIASEFHRMALELLRPVHMIADERPADELKGAAAAAAIAGALERPRQALDARAHLGDGDGAAREAGALERTPDRVLEHGRADAERQGLDVVPIGGPVLEGGHRITGIPDPDPLEHAITKADVDGGQS